jgi:hypothetical protein
MAKAAAPYQQRAQQILQLAGPGHIPARIKALCKTRQGNLSGMSASRCMLLSTSLANRADGAAMQKLNNL